MKRRLHAVPNTYDEGYRTGFNAALAGGICIGFSAAVVLYVAWQVGRAAFFAGLPF